MNDLSLQFMLRSSLALLLVICVLPVIDGAPSKNLIQNPSFNEDTIENGLPTGWFLYGTAGKDLRAERINIDEKGKKGVLIFDNNQDSEIGITQAVPATPGLVYQASLKVKALPGESAAGGYLQLRFLPSQELFQVGLEAASVDRFVDISVKGLAPLDTKSAQIYIYTHTTPTPKFIVVNPTLVSGVEPPPPPVSPPPAPVPPVYLKLKDLNLVTELVRDGKPNITIVEPSSGIYHTEALQLQNTIFEITGSKVPLIKDKTFEAGVPIKGNLLVLGNRSTNRTIEELYNRGFTWNDLRYPGPEGYEVRTLHNPFGDKHNVIFVGGSDLVGIKNGTQDLRRKLLEAKGRKGYLVIGWLADIRLGKGITLPKNIQEVQTWEASAGYGSIGYFGWNSISKNMALYYMTGDPWHAREFLRLAFPDAQAKKEINQIDSERIENKDDPLAGPYHYNAHMMILLWDLIEESPVFTDEDRLRVTNAFSRQLNHRKDEGIYNHIQPPGAVGSRHGQWAAISIYCLGRYFQNSYPNPIWQHCVDAARLEFAPLHKKDAWALGEYDHLFWYSTGLAPCLTFLLLDGDREPVKNGVLATLLRGQEILISGRMPDWALTYAAIDYLHKAAYLMQDGRYLEYLRRTRLDLNIFRVGQSFWPDTKLEAHQPEDLVNKWSIHRMSKPMWESRGDKIPFDKSSQFGSFRTSTRSSGDYVLIKGYNASIRNPYHSYGILELRLGGLTVLQGFLNQLLVRADGMVEPQVALDAALLHCDVLGQTALAVAEVPKAPFCNWKRTLAQRIGRYALFVDELTFHTNSDNIEVQTKWEGKGIRTTNDGDGSLKLQSSDAPVAPKGWIYFSSLDAKCTSFPALPESLIRLDSIGIMLLRATETGSWMEMPFSLAEKTAGEVFVDFINYVDRGILRILLDGKQIGEPFDHYGQGVEAHQLSLGHQELATGEHRLRLEVIGKHPGIEKCYAGLSSLSIRPDGLPTAAGPITFDIRPSDRMNTTVKGNVGIMQWMGPVKTGDHQVFFSLLARTGDEPLACLRLNNQAALLSLPAPAIAVVGEYQDIKGDLVILAKDHLHGQNMTKAGLAGSLLSATTPIQADWDFIEQRLQVVIDKTTILALALQNGDKIHLNGKVVKLTKHSPGHYELTLQTGRYTLENAKPLPEDLEILSKHLATLIETARTEHQAKRTVTPEVTQTAPPLSETWRKNLPGSISGLLVVQRNQKSVVYASEGMSVHILTDAGQDIRTLQTEGNIRCLRWWAEHRLLLVGCVDEKVIAFDEDGNRKWTFVSEMDPAVFRAGKDYWFKSASGHEGIHALHTGVFLEGKSQAFVGSACTTEIIDQDGKLIKRLPTFWGPGTNLTLIDGPKGSIKLLVGRWHSDGINLIIINNRTLDPNTRGFYGVPVGHTYISGWDCMNRRHIFYEDLEGDGKKRVVSEINGFWNRVTVWTQEGNPLYNAQFGPGETDAFAQYMRDLDIGDINGDGKKEIITATSSGLVVALDSRCQKLWTKRLPSPATVLKCVQLNDSSAFSIVVGCGDGTIAVLDGKGDIILQSKVSGCPTVIENIEVKGKPSIVIATSKGELGVITK